MWELTEIVAKKLLHRSSLNSEKPSSTEERLSRRIYTVEISVALDLKSFISELMANWQCRQAMIPNIIRKSESAKTSV